MSDDKNPFGDFFAEMIGKGAKEFFEHVAGGGSPLRDDQESAESKLFKLTRRLQDATQQDSTNPLVLLDTLLGQVDQLATERDRAHAEVDREKRWAEGAVLEKIVDEFGGAPEGGMTDDQIVKKVRELVANQLTAEMVIKLGRYDSMATAVETSEANKRNVGQERNRLWDALLKIADATGFTLGIDDEAELAEHVRSNWANEQVTLHQVAELSRIPAMQDTIDHSNNRIEGYETRLRDLLAALGISVTGEVAQLGQARELMQELAELRKGHAAPPSIGAPTIVASSLNEGEQATNPPSYLVSAGTHVKLRDTVGALAEAPEGKEWELAVTYDLENRCHVFSLIGPVAPVLPMPPRQYWPQRGAQGHKGSIADAPVDLREAMALVVREARGYGVTVVVDQRVNDVDVDADDPDGDYELVPDPEALTDEVVMSLRDDQGRRKYARMSYEGLPEPTVDPSDLPDGEFMPDATGELTKQKLDRQMRRNAADPRVDDLVGILSIFFDRYRKAKGSPTVGEVDELIADLGRLVED